MNWEKHHKTLGCYDCKFADKKSLGIEPACTFNGRLKIYDDKCLTKQKEDKNG